MPCGNTSLYFNVLKVYGWALVIGAHETTWCQANYPGAGMNQCTDIQCRFPGLCKVCFGHYSLIEVLIPTAIADARVV